MHRDASLFPSPDTFLPDRWLETPQNRDELLRMTQHLMPFGTGSRICGGQNFAQVMLKVAVATIVRNFDIVAPPETNERTMEMRDSFVRIVVYTKSFSSDSLITRSSSPRRWSASLYSTFESNNDLLTPHAVFLYSSATLFKQQTRIHPPRPSSVAAMPGQCRITTSACVTFVCSQLLYCFLGSSRTHNFPLTQDDTFGHSSPLFRFLLCCIVEPHGLHTHIL